MIRQAIKKSKVFPTDDSVRKVIYLVIKYVSKNYAGIENPRVLGSIIRSASSSHPCGAVASDVQSRCVGCPSPGILFRETSLTAGFLLSDVWTLHRTCLVRGGESGAQHSLPMSLPSSCHPVPMPNSRGGSAIADGVKEHAIMRANHTE
ncbi:hypothetical protein B4901_19885 [Yersinia frederiksenii]|nr:hypothetical protein B4901_19885 [Yersinia frederiksenii]